MFAYDMGKASMSTPPSMLQTAAGNPKVCISVNGNSEDNNEHLALSVRP